MRPLILYSRINSIISKYARMPFTSTCRMSKINVLMAAQVDQFNKDGYLVVENFISPEMCDNLKKDMQDLINNHDFSDFDHIFAANAKGISDEKFHDSYFMESWNKVHFFLEKDQPQTTVCGEAKPRINKVGHALHKAVPRFREVAFNDRVRTVCEQLGLQCPAVCQSMYIFKSPTGGAAVPPHQDASFLWTEPECRILGFWIPLEDVTLDNGCLWAVPGSHKSGLLNDVRFVWDRSLGKYATRLTADYPAEHEQGAYTPLIVPRGGLVLIHGYVLHKSLVNESPRPRDVFTWHVVETGDGTTWHCDNWIQPPGGIADFEII